MKARLKRPCNSCNKTFTPRSKLNWVCRKCTEKNRLRGMEIRTAKRKTAIDKKREDIIRKLADDSNTHSYYKGEQTEQKFSKWCLAKKYWRQKIRVPLELDELGINKALAQPCDFIVITKKETKWIEIKEIFRGKIFVKDRFSQHNRLYNLSQIGKSSTGYILLNFVEHKKIAYLSIEQYDKIYKATHKKKSLNIGDIPKHYICDWKTLTL